MGIVFPIGMIGEAIGPVLAGGIFDATGTYSLAFAILAATSIIGLACAIFARSP
jgi:cyanate permease